MSGCRSRNLGSLGFFVLAAALGGPVAALVAIDLGGVAHGVLRHAVPSAGETWVSIPATVASWVAGNTRAPYWMAMTPSITASPPVGLLRWVRGPLRAPLLQLVRLFVAV